MIRAASPAFHRSRVLGGSTLAAFWETIALLGCVLIAPIVFVVFAPAACPLGSLNSPSASPPFSALARMQAPAGIRAGMARATFIAGNGRTVVRSCLGFRLVMDKSTGISESAMPG